MVALLYRFGAELRSRWRPWLGLALVVALAAGAVMTLAAGARRTDSSYSRFLEEKNAYDVVVVNYPEDGTAVFDFDELAALPMVEDSARAHFNYYAFAAGAVVDSTGRIGTEINTFKMLEGRRADPEAADEMVVGFVLAEELGLEVGDTVDVFPPELVEFARSPETVPFPFGDDRAPPEEEAALLEWLRTTLDAIPDGKARIVGIEASPGEFPPQYALNRPLVHMTPAAAQFLDDGVHEILAVRVRDGDAGVAAFQAELDRRSGGLPLTLAIQGEHAAAVQRSIHLQAVALWILAGLTALASVLVVGQLLARMTTVESTDHPTLRALGMAPQARAALGVTRAVAIGVVGGIIGAVGAWLASAAFPLGLARTAEAAPGMRADVLVLVVGPIATVLVTGALSVWPAWRVAHADGRFRSARAGPSRLARGLATRGAPAPAVVGVGMAFDSGQGRNALPARTTLVGVALGIAAITGALTFGYSLAHLQSSPPLYGVTWDLELVTGDGSGLGPAGTEFLSGDERVTDVAFGGAHFGRRIDVEGEPLDAIVVGDPLKGTITPAVLDGRGPAAADEIALGPQSLRSLGAQLGDTVMVGLGGGEPIAMEVVGTAILPTVAEGAQLGRGAIVTPEAALVLGGLDGEQVDTYFGALVNVAPDVDTEELVADLEAQLDLDFGTGVLVNDDAAPTDIVNFGRVESLPFVLGGILAAIAAAALAHLLVTSVQRRRRDLAILKTLGFVRRDVALAIASQASTVAAVSVVVGVPLGVALGRWVWTEMADSLGVVPDPQVPFASLAIVALAAVAVANAVALVPALVAARTRPGTVLRTE